ncbi:MAG: NTP transferase domain-containing protein [Tepidibacter sp.]|jgi:CTP:molybdopterin cytidylyltransferase MocA|uniref:DVU_1551 family NTP transferase n=1 Tax=Tepidibacter sp. TaxID=2529387 RepID=UPI0025D91575|nr:NTP transferase domain-containing protein [Tepidibacter sp.]MCT4507588.1 NTP transferase domain-containing protein [Tepidibacter sp.]
MKKYAAIILSAGYSSRMGEFKPVMDLHGQTAINRVINTFKEANIDNIYVVSGHNDDLIKNIVDAKVVHNKYFDKGMLESVKTGVSQLSEDIDAFFILPVDIPCINSYTLKTIIHEYEKRNYIVIHPTFSNIKGHPPFISTSISKKILSYNESGGLKNLLSFYKDRSKNIQVADRGILLDMDNKEDYKVILDYISYFPYPDELECKEIMRICNVNEKTKLHMEYVAKLARVIALKLNENGCNININLTYTGALLHDIKKGEKQHAKQGAVTISKLGYPCLYEVIKSHMDISEIEKIGEREIIYICDKLIKEAQMIDINERHKSSINRYKNCEDAVSNINKRFDNAKKIKNMIEEIIGCQIEKLQIKG